MSSYTTLATIYENLMKDCDYEQWSQYLYSSIKKYTQGICGLDLACGSGKMTRMLVDFGFKMTGGDISQEMLTQAKQISLQKKQRLLETNVIFMYTDSKEIFKGVLLWNNW